MYVFGTIKWTKNNKVLKNWRHHNNGAKIISKIYFAIKQSNQFPTCQPAAVSRLCYEHFLISYKRYENIVNTQ